MKKVSLFLGMVLAASFAMAQNTANTHSIGNSNQVTVTQAGANNLVGRVATTDSPVTYSSQTGDENKATVTQTGDRNKAFFEQGYSERYATGPFLGSGLYGTEGDKNEITISQVGSDNSAGGFSLGNENIVNLTQVGSNDYSGHWLWGDKNKATISQTGNNENWAYASANSSNNTSVINQVGYKNDGSTSQGWIGYAWHDQNTASISQTGNYNKSSLANGFDSRDNSPGAFDPALPGYTWDLFGYGIQQYGFKNVGSVTQNGNSNEGAIYQFGNYNEGQITQTSDLNKANLLQLGSNNFARLNQTSGANANIRQEGDNNTLKGLANEWTTYSWEGSKLDLTQDGNLNTLNILQRSGASADVMQVGNSNVATISQLP